MPATTATRAAASEAPTTSVSAPAGSSTAARRQRLLWSPSRSIPSTADKRARDARLKKTAFSPVASSSAATGGGASQAELPPQQVVTDRPFEVTATFSEPGTYTLRAMAHDGGLHDAADVTITVR